MSVRVQTYVWQLDLPPSEKLVAIALADHCHDDGSEARPSVQTLVNKTGLSNRQVRRVLDILKQKGVIKLERPWGQHRANVYRFPLPDDFGVIHRRARVDKVTTLTKSRVDISASRVDICDTQSGHGDHLTIKNHLLNQETSTSEVEPTEQIASPDFRRAIIAATREALRSPAQ